MSKQLQQAIRLIKEGQKQQGRQLLAEILKREPKHELAWLWLAGVVDSDEQRRHCLKQVLAINPNNTHAQQGLARLPQKVKVRRLVKQPAPISQLQPAPAEEETPLERLQWPVSAPPILPEPTSPSSRTVWLNPDNLRARVTALFEDAVVVANPDSATLKEIETSLQQGSFSASLLGQKLKAVPLDAITSVTSNKHHSKVNIYYQLGQKAQYLNVPFATQESRDEFFAALQARLGPKFEAEVKEFNIFQAMITPLLVLGVLILATYLCHGAALEAAAGVEPEIRGRRQLLKLVAAWAITLLGPTGILILGVILGALILFWMFSRMVTPPVMMKLVPAKTPRPVKSKAEMVAVPTPASTPLPPAPKQTPMTSPVPKPAPAPLPAPSRSPAPPRSRLSLATVIRFVLITVVAVVLSLATLVGTWYWSLPPSFPGLIEGGTALDLSGRNLTSADLEALSLDQVPQENLVTVDFSRNQLTTLPAEIGSFKNVESLYIKENQLTTLPPEIGQLSTLTNLHLNVNQITALPPEIGQLTNLEYLDLQSNKLKTLPPEIGRLPKLKTLNVQFNYNIQLPPEIEQKPGLYIYR